MTRDPAKDIDGIVAILAPRSQNAAAYVAAVEHGSGQPLPIGFDEPLPAEAGALLVIGTATFDGEISAALQAALDSDVPVLGVNWGMHAVNTALGGKAPVPVDGVTGEPAKMPVFISPGAKLSYTIAGSGWVSALFSNTMGIRPAEMAPGLMASCYREDGFLAAIEMPGRNWVLGVQWNAHEVDTLPSGFDSLLLALVERAAGIQ